MMPASRVRPYAITGGRTRPAGDHLTATTRVAVADPDPARALDLPPESLAIFEQARRPITVAELTEALPDIPATTVLVLLSDLIEANLIVPTEADKDESDQDMLGRILDGLRELSP